MASLRKLTVAELRRELERREKGASKLSARRAKLVARVAALDAELAALGLGAPARGRKPGRPAGSRGGRRSKGGLTLMQALEKGVTTGKTVSPMEAGAAARRAGYKTSSKTFGVQVATALAKATGFKKLGRGQYQRLAGGGGARKAKPKGKRGGKKRKAKAGRKAGRKPGRPKGMKKAAAPATAKTEAAAS